MQAPGRPEEDTRGGFAHGSWGERYVDDQALGAMYARVAEGGGLQLLLGRRSYEDIQQRPEVRGLENAARAAASNSPTVSDRSLARRDR